MIPAGGPNAAAPGSSSALTMVMEPGNVAIVCFLADAKDGKPHFVHGIIQQVKIG